MKKSPIALAFFALLFAGWMVYLGSQAWWKSNPVVVSRAQLLVSRYEVEVDLKDAPAGTDPARLTVRNVLYAADDQKPAGEIAVANLGQTDGYVGPGAYLLPLVRKGEQYEVAGYPTDPGYPLSHDAPRPRIYPLTADVRQQLEQIRSP